MVRIKWSTSIGLGGRHRSEQVVDIIGIRMFWMFFDQPLLVNPIYLHLFPYQAE